MNDSILVHVCILIAYTVSLTVANHSRKCLLITWSLSSPKKAHNDFDATEIVMLISDHQVADERQNSPVMTIKNNIILINSQLLSLLNVR